MSDIEDKDDDKDNKFRPQGKPDSILGLGDVCQQKKK